MNTPTIHIKLPRPRPCIKLTGPLVYKLRTAHPTTPSRALAGHLGCAYRPSVGRGEGLLGVGAEAQPWE
jgi:hypothetical protein